MLGEKIVRFYRLIFAGQMTDFCWPIFIGRQNQSTLSIVWHPL